MDPTACLQEIRELGEQIRNGDVRESVIEDYTSAVIALDEWLSKGGFPPSTWTAGLVTLDDLHALSEITDACIHGYRVARLMESGEVLEGVARSIGDERGNFLRRDEDVRAGYLRVSSMFEHFWPIRELMPLVKRSEFVVRRGES